MATKDLVITLMEKDNYECPNIGTIIYKGDDVDFMERIKIALEEHFDAEVLELRVANNLTPMDAYNSPPIDAVVITGEDCFNPEIEIHQTWLY